MTTLRAAAQTLRKSAAIFLLSVFFLLAFFSPQTAFAKQKSKSRDYALIAGTVWGPDDRPVYGIKIRIRRAKDKKPKWEVYSDHNGEFAQRVPIGDCDYILTADLKGVKTRDGQPLQAKEVTVHIYDDEREDTGVHLTH